MVLIYHEGSGANLRIKRTDNSVPLREFADLIDELLALEVIVGVAQHEQEALDNDIHVLRVAHSMQNMQCLAMIMRSAPLPTELRMEISSLSSAFSTTICRRTTYCGYP